MVQVLVKNGRHMHMRHAFQRRSQTNTHAEGLSRVWLV